MAKNVIDFGFSRTVHMANRFRYVRDSTGRIQIVFELRAFSKLIEPPEYESWMEDGAYLLVHE